MKTKIQTVKGTRDFYPEEMAVRSWLYQVIREVSESFGYREYDGPFLERIDLYAAKSGEELVKEQSFVFQDRGGDDIALRPELTPTLARMVVQKQNALTFPLRWWSFGPFWRYERPQKGRTREFFQWNIDLIGAETPEADAELVAVCAKFFEKVGLEPDKVNILVNDRELIDQLLVDLEITADMKRVVFRLIDRREKMSAGEWKAYALEELKLTPAQFDGIQSILQDGELWKKSPNLVRLFKALEAMGAREYVRFDAQIIRGLDYYTGIVFEAKDQDKEGRSILGGGHYGNLVGDVGGNPLPGVGFAMGDVMATLILEKYGCLPEMADSPAPVMVTVFDEERLPGALNLATEIRAGGLNVFSYPDPIKLQKQLKYADRMGAQLVVIMGPDEEASQLVTIKNLKTRDQETVSRETMVLKLREMLAEGHSM